MRGIQGCPGEQYGYWTLVSKTPGRPNYWLCRCVCGKMRDVQLQSLRRGISVSCGCKKSELISQKNRLDLTGKRYGMLSVIETETIDKYGYILWLCKCDCGNTVLKRASLLSAGNICSCGCMKPPKRSAGAKRLDMVGKTFVYLTVLSPAPDRGGRSYWHCRCVCGKEKDIRGSSLTSGVTKSCGCLKYRKMLQKKS